MNQITTEVVNRLIWVEVLDSDGRIGWIPAAYLEIITRTSTKTLTLTLTSTGILTNTTSVSLIMVVTSRGLNISKRPAIRSLHLTLGLRWKSMGYVYTQNAHHLTPLGVRVIGFQNMFPPETINAISLFVSQSQLRPRGNPRLSCRIKFPFEVVKYQINNPWYIIMFVENNTAEQWGGYIDRNNGGCLRCN